MRKKKTALAGVLAAAVLFFAVNLIAGLTLRHARFDLTAEGLYSLSDGSRKVLAAIDEPIRFDFYEYLDEVKDERPDLVNHAQRIREFLEEMVLAADGGLILNVRKPEPFSEAEDDARTAGVAAVPTSQFGEEVLYLGLVATNAVDETEVVPFFMPRPDKDAFLEYDLAKIVHDLSQPKKPKVGLISSLPVDSRFDPTNPQGGPTPAWQFLNQLRQSFGVESVQPAATELPAELDVLLLVHPKGLSEDLLRAIDRFALGGGRILAFLDPLCQEEAQSQANPYGQPPAPTPSELGPLLAAWGVQWDPTEVLTDRELALKLQTRTERGIAAVDHVAVFAAGAAQMAAGDPIAGGLETVRFAMPGELRAASDATSTFEPLIHTTKNAALIDAGRFQYLFDHSELLEGYLPDGVEHTVAARIGGTIRSAFPAPAAAGEEAGDGAAAPPSESSAPARIVLVADVDVLADYLWVQEERLGPISLGLRITADNGSLVLNAVELLAGNEALASIRGNRVYQRPFDVVEQLEREAQDRYQARESQLEQEIRDAEMRINEMQREKAEDAAFILSPGQVAAIDKLEQDMVAARKELRQVRHELNRGIEALGTRLMLLNTVGVPLLVAALAFLWHLRRARRKRVA